MTDESTNQDQSYNQVNQPVNSTTSPQTVSLDKYRAHTMGYFALGVVICLVITFIFRSGFITINVDALSKECEVDFSRMAVRDLEDSLESVLMKDSPEEMYKLGMYMMESGRASVYSPYGYAVISIAAEEGNKCAKRFLSNYGAPPLRTAEYEREIIELRNEFKREAMRDPADKLKDARNSQRRSDVNTILNAMYQYAIDHNGTIPGDIPVGQEIEICSGENADCTDLLELHEFLTGSYLTAIPVDPQKSGDGAGYTVLMSANKRITITSMYPEGDKKISVTR